MVTYFIDLHGTLVKHQGPEDYDKPLEILPGVVEWSRRQHRLGNRIVVLTGAPASLEAKFEQELVDGGVVYHEMLSDVGSGTRVLINDRKPYDPALRTAIAIDCDRNETIFPDKVTSVMRDFGFGE